MPVSISKLLPATVMALALATTVGCSVDVTTPGKETKPSESQTSQAADTGSGDKPASEAPTSSAPASSGAEPLRFTGTSNSHSADCTGRDVSVEGEVLSLLLKGDCGTITVDGTSNSIAVESADAVDVKGDNNEVAVRTIGSVSLGEGTSNSVFWVRAADGDAPEVNDAGTVNEVTRVTPEEYAQAVEAAQ